MSEVGGVAGDRLRSFIERIERLEEERATIAVDIREVYAEAKANGFDPKIMRQVVKLRKMES
ncbi:MAG: GapR family DNA-binding domain-containing protein, partial [Pseudomonadota bacterium]|nr:GapR family DNA-binding domain-containing protein [Pseudomonadota bacterium]